MAKSKRKAQTPFWISLASALGLVILIVGVWSVIGGKFDLRSKAALGESIVKRWEFDSSAEGWTTTVFSNVKIAGGYLTGDYGKPIARPNPRCSTNNCQNTLYSKKSGLWMITNCSDAMDPDGDQQLCNTKGRIGWCGGNIFCCPGAKQKWTTDMTMCGGSKYPAFIHTTVNTSLPAGKKYAKIRLAVHPRTPVPNSPRSRLQNFDLILTFSGSSAVSRPISIRGIADAKFHEYTLAFPDVNSMSISSMNLRLDTLPLGSQVQLDWVRLISVIDTTPPSYPSQTPTPQIPTPTMHPTPTPTPGVFSNAYYLDGSYNYINIPGSDIVQPNLGFTFEAMYKPIMVPFNGYLVSKSNGSTNGFTIHMLAETDPQNSANTRFYYEMGVADSTLNCVARSMTNELIVPNTQAFAWQHIAGVIESDGKMKLYINGKASLFHSNQVTSTCKPVIPFALGARVLGPGDVQGYLPGVIDEVRISETSRYSADFSPPINPFTSDSLGLLLYHLDGFYGDGLIKDYSGRGYDGVSYGAIKFVPH